MLVKIIVNRGNFGIHKVLEKISRSHIRNYYYCVSFLTIFRYELWQFLQAYLLLCLPEYITNYSNF